MKIREMLPPEQQPVIIAMTASAMKEDRDRYLQVMDDFLAKVRSSFDYLMMDWIH